MINNAEPNANHGRTSGKVKSRRKEWFWNKVFYKPKLVAKIVCSVADNKLHSRIPPTNFPLSHRLLFSIFFVLLNYSQLLLLILKSDGNPRNKSLCRRNQKTQSNIDWYCASERECQVCWFCIGKRIRYTGGEIIWSSFTALCSKASWVEYL